MFIYKSIGCVILITTFLNLNIMAQSRYFSTPSESVNIISALLTDKNWQELSSYYYLQDVDSKVLDSLKSGQYFIRTEKPEVAHPGGFWRYKKPFPPNFKYLSHQQVNIDTIKVEVVLDIDQGDGIIQQGKTFFNLIKLEKGYQLLL